MTPRNLKGQAMAEQLLLSIALVLALCVAHVDGLPVGTWLLRCLFDYFRGQSFVLSIF